MVQNRDKQSFGFVFCQKAREDITTFCQLSQDISELPVNMATLHFFQWISVLGDYIWKFI